MTGYATTRHREPAPTLPFGFDDDVPFDHDPVDPHPEHPTPIDLVMRLTKPQREERVRALLAISRAKYEQTIAQHTRGKTVAATCVLVSGGDDSYTVAHAFRDVTTHHVHANTGTGIELTRQFVRKTSADWGVPLIERTPPAGQGYFDLVRGNVMAISRTTGELVRTWPGGFPGPAAHALMYQRLKERCFVQVPHDFGISGSRTERVVFIAGRRRPESQRRANVPYANTAGTIVWISPMAVWHKADLRTYRLMFPDTPRNPVAATLGMSGECGCLCYATPGEPDRWRAAYPDDPFIRQVAEVEAELADRDDIKPHRKHWGWGGMYDDPDEIEAMPANSVCGINCGRDPLLDMMDPLFELDTVGSVTT